MGGVFSTKPDTTDQQPDENIHIRNYVKTLLKDKRVNKSMVPDAIEQKLYEQVLGTLVADLTKILEDAKIEILGQEIRFVVSPKLILDG